MIFSVLAFIALITSICIKDRKKSIFVQSLDCLFTSIYDFIIGALTGAVLSLMNFIRSLMFANKARFSRGAYFILLLFFEGIIIGNCYFSWAGWISLLPTIGSIIRTFCLWQPDMRLVRFSGITSGIFYTLYYIYYHSFFMTLGYALLLIISTYEYIAIDIKNKKKLNEELTQESQEELNYE